MKRNVPVVKLCMYVSECVCSKIIKELPGLVGSGTPCTKKKLWNNIDNKNYLFDFGNVHVHIELRYS